MEGRGVKCVLKYRVVLWLTWYRLCSASVSARLIVCIRTYVRACVFFFSGCWMFWRWLHPSSTLINSGSLYRWSSRQAFRSNSVSMLKSSKRSTPTKCFLKAKRSIMSFSSFLRRHPCLSYNHSHRHISGVSLRRVRWVHFHHSQWL